MGAKAASEAIAYWHEQQGDRPLDVVALHEWLAAEHDYVGCHRSIQHYWRRAFRAPAVRARRQVETPPGAQAQVDWAHFPRVVVGGEQLDALALHMVLSHSRHEAVVWSLGKDQLARLDCHTQEFKGSVL